MGSHCLCYCGIHSYFATPRMDGSASAWRYLCGLRNKQIFKRDIWCLHTNISWSDMGAAIYIYSVSLENSREFEVWLEYNELKIVDSYKGEKLTNKIRSDLENGLKLNDQIEIPAPTAGCSFPINDYGKICSGIFFDGISSKNPDMECSKECFSDTVYEICKNIKNEYNITSLTAIYRFRNGESQELNIMLTYLPNFEEKIITVVIKLSPKVIYNIRTREQL